MAEVTPALLVMIAALKTLTKMQEDEGKQLVPEGFLTAGEDKYHNATEQPLTAGEDEGNQAVPEGPLTIRESEDVSNAPGESLVMEKKDKEK